MVKRCTQKNDKTYKSYGAKGITICDRWLEKPYGFKNFIEDMGPKPEGTSLDRIDNNKGYSPDNCRWATYSQQSYNRKDWSGHRGIQKVTFYKGKFGPYVRYDGEFVSIPKGIDPQHITIEEVEELLNQKADAATPLLEFGDIRVMNGRYGAYLKVGDANYKLPRGTKVDALTKEQCEEIIKNSENAPKKSSFRRKK